MFDFSSGHESPLPSVAAPCPWARHIPAPAPSPREEKEIRKFAIPDCDSAIYCRFPKSQVTNESITRNAAFGVAGINLYRK